MRFGQHVDGRGLTGRERARHALDVDRRLAAGLGDRAALVERQTAPSLQGQLEPGRVERAARGQRKQIERGVHAVERIEFHAHDDSRLWAAREPLRPASAPPEGAKQARCHDDAMHWGMTVAGVRDQLGRPLGDLRVSVTDRCNFRCRYCMPREHFDQEHRYLPRADILSFEEIARVVAALQPLGLRKVRLTGGEPLLRSELHRLVALLRRLPGLELALTTNASLLAKQASALRDAGLDRLTVSLDSVSPEVFARMTDSDLPVSEVLSGIDAAHAAGFGPIKINAVVRRGGERPHHRGARASLQGAAATSCASSNTWMWA